MNVHNRFFSIVCFCLLLLAVSCTKQLNTNLNDPNGLTLNQLGGGKSIFPQALVATATNKVGTCVINNTDNYDFAQQWMGYWALNTGWSASGAEAEMLYFNFTNSFFDGNWTSLYHNIYDYDYVITNSTQNSILPGAAMVMRAMVFQDLVDQFGNIPYSQALKDTQNITPGYDAAPAIYQSLVNQVDSAITSLEASQSTSDDVADIMFKGNKQLWLQFANTIKLRLLLRQVPNVYAANDPYITGEINKTISYGFLRAAQDAAVQPGFTDAAQKQSPFWADYGHQPGWTPGSTVAPYQNYTFYVGNNAMIGFLQTTGDPRLGYFYAQNFNSKYVGEDFFSNVNPASSHIGPGILQSASMPALIFSASQSFFMQAEAAQRGMLPGSYASLYQQGVEESFRYLMAGASTASSTAVTAADNFVAGSTSPYVNIATSSNALQTILYQKWVAECELDGLEAWSDFRRTGYPAATLSTTTYASDGETPTSISLSALSGMPLRLLYPEVEYTTNTANVNAQNQTASDLNTKLFWGM